MSTWTSAPAAVSARASSADLYAAIEPVTPSRISRPLERSAHALGTAGSADVRVEQRQAAQGQQRVDGVTPGMALAQPVCDSPPVRITLGCPLTASSGAHCPNEQLDHADVAQHRATLDGLDSVVADALAAACRARTRGQLGGLRGERVDAQPEAGRDRAAEELAVRADDVERGGSANVDDYRRRAVQLGSGIGIRPAGRRQPRPLVDPGQADGQRFRVAPRAAGMPRRTASSRDCRR